MKYHLPSTILRFFIGGLGLALLIWCAIPLWYGVFGPGGLLGFLVAGFLLASAIFYKRLHRLWTTSPHKRRNKILRNVVLTCLALGVLWSSFLTVCMISSNLAVPPETATVVVLGSEVKGSIPSADLMERIRTAADYLKATPQAMVVVSGGQGKGEDISEAEAMRRGLVSLGIEEARILMEERSTDTKENIQYSMEIIRSNKLSQEIAIVTDDYHQFRANHIAKRQGVESFAVPAKTPWYIFSSCYLRELLALTKFFLLP